MMTEGLWIAVIAACSALLGSAIGQLGSLVQEFLVAKRERRAVVRSRYEEMVHLCGQALPAVVESTAENDSSKSLGGVGLLESVGRMRALALMYFPEFQDPLDEMQRAMFSWAMASKDGTDISKARNEFSSKRDRVHELIVKHAKKYT